MKSWLKTQHSKDKYHGAWSHYFIANRGKMGTVIDFIFLGSKLTLNSNFSHEIKRHLLLKRKAVINLDCIFKSRDITLPVKVYIVKAVLFLVVMYEYESWIIEKVEC